MRDKVHITGRHRDKKMKTAARTGVPAEGTLDPARPVLLAVDGDAGARRVIERELCKRYGEDYRVVCEGSAEAAMRRLRGFAAAGDDVAVVLADQWTPGMSGT
jgi:thioredoxin reductase (NADPH)